MRPTYPIILSLAILLCLTAADPPQAHGFSLFSSREKRSEDLVPFPKWTGVLARTDKSRNKKCSDGGCNPLSWEDTTASLPKNLAGKAMLRLINDRFNEAEYILDIKNWGMTDYWATPLQFLIKDGDCEDYAIAKYMALRALGWPADQMRIVVLQDENLNILHSVLAVNTEGSNYILDNQIPSLVTDRQIHHYLPIYSINEDAWWQHLP